MSSVLSTKKLSLAQKTLLLNSGIGLVETDFISIVPLAFEIPYIPEHLIFTSKNAVRQVLQNPKLPNLKQKKIFCVGEKTATYLTDKGFNVVEIAPYGAALGKRIAEFYSRRSFIFFCGKRRNPELAEKLRSQDILLKEVEVYDTILTPKSFDRTFDGILFFSPAAVESYSEKNEIQNSTAFCIGKTTAAVARKLTQNLIIANKPTIENLIVQVVKKLK